jgi:hypothetical protein
LLLNQHLSFGEFWKVREHDRADAGCDCKFLLKYFDVDSSLFHKIKRNIELYEIIRGVEDYIFL